MLATRVKCIVDIPCNGAWRRKCQTRAASLHEHHKLSVFDNSERTVILRTPSGNVSTEKSVERKIKQKKRKNHRVSSLVSGRWDIITGC